MVATQIGLCALRPPAAYPDAAMGRLLRRRSLRRVVSLVAVLGVIAIAALVVAAAGPATSGGTVATRSPRRSSVPLAPGGVNHAVLAPTPDARSFAGVATVGALFESPSPSPGGHFCTASVIASPRRDLALTAAHCVSPGGPPLYFVPDYRAGAQAPYGVWRVAEVVENRQWLVGADPDDDFALLVIAPRDGVPIQQVTGAETLGIGGRVDVDDPIDVTVDGYPDGSGGPITCTGELQTFGLNELQFVCGGFSDGTSGSPLLVHDHGEVVVGVIGGFDQGGDSPTVSFAARFEASMAELYRSVTGVSAPPAG
jgi:V8-like Glu-specific endopeptidase